MFRCNLNGTCLGLEGRVPRGRTSAMPKRQQEAQENDCAQASQAKANRAAARKVSARRDGARAATKRPAVDRSSRGRQASSKGRIVRGPYHQRGEFRSPHPGVVPAANGRDPSRPHRRHPWRPAHQLSPIPRAGAAAGFGAGAPRHRAGRYRVGHAAQRARHAGGPLRRADAGRSAQHHQYAARCRDHRLYPGARRSQGADHGPRIRGAGRPRARAAQAAAAGDRRRRPALFRTGRAAGRNRV